jgi:hypothetical protein
VVYVSIANKKDCYWDAEGQNMQAWHKLHYKESRRGRSILWQAGILQESGRRSICEHRRQKRQCKGSGGQYL